MVEILKVRYKNGDGWESLPTFKERVVFPSVQAAREHFSKQLETNKIVLYYAESL